MTNSLTIQYAVNCLRELDQEAPRTLTVAELGRRLGVPAEDCSDILDRLEAAGIVDLDLAGGIHLERPVEELTALEIIQALGSARRTPEFAMLYQSADGPIVRKTLEAVAWSQGLDVYPGEVR